MKRNIFLLSLLTLLLIAGAAVADATGYDLPWWTVDSGGGTSGSANGSYTLRGTIGQPDAGVLSGDDYTLTGGFWGGAAPAYRIYMPVVLRS
jgi:hypothetical protein